MKKFIYLILIVGIVGFITSNFTVYKINHNIFCKELLGSSISIKKTAVNKDTKRQITSIRKGEEFIYILEGSDDSWITKIDDLISENLELISVSTDQYTYENNLLELRLELDSNDFYVELRVRVRDSASLGELKNTAFLYITSSGVEAEAIVNILSPELSITKVASKENVSIGEEFTYDIVIKNSGNIDSEKLTITDVIPDELEIVDKGDFTLTNNTLTYELDTLKVGEEKKFTVGVKVKESVKKSGEIKNTAVLKEEGHGEIESSDDVLVKISELSVNKEVVNNKNYLPKDKVEYKITIKNNGLEKSTNIIVTDTLSEYLIINEAKGATINGNTLTWKLDELEAGKEVTFTYTAYIKENITKNTDIKNKVVVKDDKEEVSDEEVIKVVVEVENPETNYKIGMYIGIIGLSIGIIIFKKYKKNNFYKI